jgi:hypothetical protein
MALATTLAYHDAATTTAVESFIVLGPGFVFIGLKGRKEKRKTRDKIG